MKKELISVLFMLFILSVVSVLAISNLPKQLTVQGELRNATTGLPVADGYYNITFSIYNLSSGGSAIWQESINTSISKSIYTAILGTQTALNLPFNTSYFLGINVNSDGEMSPRINMTSVPYSYETAIAQNITISQTNISTTGNLTLGQKITFVLGQIIDGITAGIVKVTGNLFVSGDINATNINATALNVSGTATVNNLNVSNWITAFSTNTTNLNVSGNATFNNINVTGTASINSLNISGMIISQGNINVSGNLTLGQKITFALGEMIDNIVNGIIRITGNLFVSGDINATNINATALNVSGTATVNNLNASNNYASNYYNASGGKEWVTADYLANYSMIATVDASGNADFTSIQSAINYLSAKGPTSTNRALVLIYPGNYSESVVIANYVDITGVGYRDSVYLDTSSGDLITANGVNSIISNIYLRTYAGGGIMVSNGASVTVAHCNLANSGGGINIESGGSVAIIESNLCQGASGGGNIFFADTNTANSINITRSTIEPSNYLADIVQVGPSMQYTLDYGNMYIKDSVITKGPAANSTFYVSSGTTLNITLDNSIIENYVKEGDGTVNLFRKGTIYSNITNINNLQKAPTDSPATCNSITEGTIYADDSLNKPCYCNSTAWIQMDDFTTAC